MLSHNHNKAIDVLHVHRHIYILNVGQSLTWPQLKRKQKYTHTVIATPRLPVGVAMINLCANMLLQNHQAGKYDSLLCAITDVFQSWFKNT